MSGQSGPNPSRFRGLFESALQDYERTTNIILVKHPLAEQLQDYNSIESIVTFFQGHARKIDDFQRSGRIMNSIENIVSVLCLLSATAPIGDSVYLVIFHEVHGGDPCLMSIPQSFPPTKLIQIGLAILLDVGVLFEFSSAESSHTNVSGGQGVECQL
jgi:hypothetical protein